MTDLRIVDVDITPVAVKDPPLLNSSGVHEPFALRSIIEVHTDAGITGISEAYGDDATLALLQPGRRRADRSGRLRPQRPDRPGRAGARRGPRLLPDRADRRGERGQDRRADRRGLRSGLLRRAGQGDRPAAWPTCSAARCASRSTSAPTCSTSGPITPATAPARPTWGAALDPDGIVAQARRMVDRYGFGSLKLKGGVFAPEEEIEAVKALRARVPGPSGAHRPERELVGARPATASRRRWRVSWSTWRTRRPASPAWPRSRRGPSLPLATNMCVTCFAEIPESVRLGAVQVILSDHHFWGGLRATQSAGRHLRDLRPGTVDALEHAPGHQPRRDDAPGRRDPEPDATRSTRTRRGRSEAEDVDRRRPRWPFTRRRAWRLPHGPGLGVEIDRDALARLHEQYLTCGFRRRDDVAWMRRVQPEWTGKRPRF